MVLLLALRVSSFVVVQDGLTYLCMSDTEFDRPLAFQFLADIKDRFQATYGERAKTAIAFAFNADFARVLQAQMEKYNSERDPKIAKIRQQLGEIKDVMLENGQLPLSLSLSLATATRSLHLYCLLVRKV